ncbi:MAG: hypothetical protein KGL39_51120, partial [Patescibacteria group bacterium]|nr:hypothetical protein [Patescibacteria group bacterium]
MSDTSVLVILGASRSNKLMPRYLDQLQAGGINFHVESLPELTSSSDGTLGWCVRKWMDFAERFERYERLVLTDAWDVLFFGDRDELCWKLSLFAPHVLFASEKNCYPEGFLADKIKGEGPHKFVNGGMLTASPDELWRWCREVERHSEYEPRMIGQQWMNRRLAEQSPLARIDSQTQLFFCLFGGYDELEFENGRMVNRMYGTRPLFA